jgi:hypothetical protein
LKNYYGSYLLSCAAFGSGITYYTRIGLHRKWVQIMAGEPARRIKSRSLLVLI